MESLNKQKADLERKIEEVNGRISNQMQWLPSLRASVDDYELRAELGATERKSYESAKKDLAGAEAGYAANQAQLADLRAQLTDIDLEIDAIIMESE